AQVALDGNEFLPLGSDGKFGLHKLSSTTIRDCNRLPGRELGDGTPFATQSGAGTSPASRAQKGGPVMPTLSPARSDHYRPLGAAPGWTIHAFGVTDTGHVRHRNEDHFLIAELSK